MPRPVVTVCAGPELFRSFFSSPQRQRLARHFRWQRDGSRTLTPALRSKLRSTDAVITTWDSPHFDEALPQLAPQLRVIAHCGGEVKSRFALPLFKSLTITAAPVPMAKATAEFGATMLMYCARNVDFYRDALRKHANKIYDDLHLHGCSESIIGREIAMIGFGRIGRSLVDLMRGFDLTWLVHDPYAPRSLEKKYPVQFVSLSALLPKADLLVLAAALTEETRGLLSKSRLARLPDGAAIINIARGGLIDLDALTQDVKRKRLRCALDVTDPLEPLPVGHPLRRLPGAIVTPHMAACNHQVRHAMADVVLNDLERFFAGKNVENRVTTFMLDRMT
jgi:phosphoglycerate dehydrogenase-like enzyme